MTASQVAASTTLIASAAVLAYLGFQLYQKKKTLRIPTKWEEIGTLTGLYLYPLKSGHQIELKEADCTRVGIKQTIYDEKVLQLRDRGLVVYTEKDNEFRTARTYPKMLQIDVSVHDESHLALDAPTMRTLYVKVPKDTNKEITIKLHGGESCKTIDCGDEAALWLSRLILAKDNGLRLGYHDGITERDITRVQEKNMSFYKNLTNFSTGLYPDLTSMSLLNQASVNDLNEKVGDSTITVHNFRPNLVVNGHNLQPFDEDNWEWVKIGDVVMRNVKEITRCVLTTIDPLTTIQNRNMEPLTTLKKYRMSAGPATLPVMGIHLEVRQSGILKLGEKVFVSRIQQQA